MIIYTSLVLVLFNFQGCCQSNSATILLSLLLHVKLMLKVIFLLTSAQSKLRSQKNASSEKFQFRKILHGSQIVLKVLKFCPFWKSPKKSPKFQLFILKILKFGSPAQFFCGDFSLKLGKLERNLEQIEEGQYLQLVYICRSLFYLV